MKVIQGTMWLLPEMNETPFKIFFWINESKIYKTT